MVNFVNKLNDNPNGTLVSNEVITFTGMNILHSFLHNNVMEAKGIELWTGLGKTGTKITDYTVAQNAAKPWVYELTFGAGVTAGTYYLTYYSAGDSSDADSINNIQNEIINLSKKQFDVKDYGAIGDKVANDTPKIQAAIDAAYNAGGGKVIIPDGDYLLFSELVVKTNVHILCARGAVLYKEHDGYMITNGVVGATYPSYGAFSQITIEGGIWDSQGAKIPVMHNTFAIGHGQDLTFKNLTIKDTAGSHAIELCACKNVLVENCKFLGLYDTGARNFSEAIQIDLMKDASHFGAFGGYDHTPCVDITVRDCYFGASGTAGTLPWGRGVGSHAATIGVWHSQINIVNNFFDNLACQAVRAYNWNDVVISSNQMKNCGAAIQVQPPDTGDVKDTFNTAGVQTNASQVCRNYTISDNIIDGGGFYTTVIGIKGEATGRINNVTISNNILDNISATSAGTNIQCEYTTNASISGNIVIGGQYTAIDITQTQFVTIANNNVRATLDNGIRAKTNAHYTTITGNTVIDAGGLGIYISGGNVANVVSGNVIVGAKGAYHMSVTSTVQKISIIGNVFNRSAGGTGGLEITSSCTNVIRMGNILNGLTVSDGSASVTTGDIL